MNAAVLDPRNFRSAWSVLSSVAEQIEADYELSVDVADWNAILDRESAGFEAIYPAPILDLARRYDVAPDGSADRAAAVRQATETLHGDAFNGEYMSECDLRDLAAMMFNAVREALVEVTR